TLPTPSPWPVRSCPGGSLATSWATSKISSNGASSSYCCASHRARSCAGSSSRRSSGSSRITTARSGSTWPRGVEHVVPLDDPAGGKLALLLCHGRDLLSQLDLRTQKAVAGEPVFRALAGKRRYVNSSRHP